MNPERLRPRFAPTGRATIRINPRQRDLFAHAAGTPRNLVHALRHAPVREGRLSVRVTRAELEALIAAAAGAAAEDRREERELAGLVRYLEEVEDRFLEPEASEDAAPGAEEPESRSGA